MIYNKMSDIQTKVSVSTRKRANVKKQEEIDKVYGYKVDIGILPRIEPIAEFDDMNLSCELYDGIYQYGFSKPSPIQSIAIPYIMNKHNIYAQSQAGTGKTGAFSIGTLSVIDPSLNAIQAIVLGNTRELVKQTHVVFSSLSRNMNLKCTLIEKTDKENVNFNPRKELEEVQSSHILISTPGKLSSYIDRKLIDLENIKIFVIDEVDKLLEEGFIEQLQVIIGGLHPDVQCCAFSATYNQETFDLLNQFVKDPIIISRKDSEMTLDLIRQFKVMLNYNDEKYMKLRDFYKKIQINQTVIFVNSKRCAIELGKWLINDNHSVGVLHGGLEVTERDEIMKKLRTCEIRVLITTDVLSRGIDVQSISVVINYDVPMKVDDYPHRIGRSGRYGKTGVAINFVVSRNRNDLEMIENIENKYKIKLELLTNVNDISELVR